MIKLNKILAALTGAAMMFGMITSSISVYAEPTETGQTTEEKTYLDEFFELSLKEIEAAGMARPEISTWEGFKVHISATSSNIKNLLGGFKVDLKEVYSDSDDSIIDFRKLTKELYRYTFNKMHIPEAIFDYCDDFECPDWVKQPAIIDTENNCLTLESNLPTNDVTVFGDTMFEGMSFSINKDCTLEYKGESLSLSAYETVMRCLYVINTYGDKDYIAEANVPYPVLSVNPALTTTATDVVSTTTTTTVSSVTANDNEDGDYDGFVVTLKNSYSVLNKDWKVEDIPASGIISVKDLTHMDMSEERIKEYLERKGSVFCQILRLYVEDTSIENIKNTAAQLEKWEAVSSVELVPNTANRRSMILEDGKIKEVEYVNGASTVTKTHDYIELEVGTAVDININDAHEPLYFSFDKEGVVKDSTITKIETNIGLKAINSGEVTLIATNYNKDKEYKIKIVVVDPVELAFAKAAEEVFEQIDADKVKAADSTVATVKNGDVNSDNAVDSKDATAVLIKYAKALNDDKTLKPEDMPGGDYNGDGKVDSLDATAILIAYAEWLIEQ